MSSDRKYDCKWFPPCEMDCGGGFCSVFWGWKQEAFRTIKEKNFQWFKDFHAGVSFKHLFFFNFKFKFLSFQVVKMLRERLAPYNVSIDEIMDWESFYDEADANFDPDYELSEEEDWDADTVYCG